jgi:hypothetical protein
MPALLFKLTKNGKEQVAIIESLDTGDLSVARRKRDRLIVAYRDVFDRLDAGEAMTQEQIKAFVSLDTVAEVKRMYEDDMTLLRGGISESDVDAVPAFQWRLILKREVVVAPSNA